MVSALISRLVVLFVGTLYPAYGSYKAIRSKNPREYVHWIMYWICFAFFTFFETFSDIFLAFLIPFYYEMKILFLAWLLCPATRGSAILYKNFVHPRLVKHEQEIDEMIETAKQNGVSAMYQLGTRGAQYASQLLATTALKGQQVLLKQIQRSYSQGDVTDAAALLGPEDEAISFRRAAPRNHNARKMIRSEPAFSDEEEDNFQIIEEDFQTVEEHDDASAMDVEDEPPKLPAKKKAPPPPPAALSSTFARPNLLSRSYSTGSTPTSSTVKRLSSYEPMTAGRYTPPSLRTTTTSTSTASRLRLSRYDTR